MLLQVKRYSWISYTAFILSILLAVLPLVYPLVSVPFDLIFALYIGIILVVILSLIALLKKHEKKLLAVFSLSLALIILGFESLLLSLAEYISYFIL